MTQTAGEVIRRTKPRTFIRVSTLPGTDQARRSAASRAAKRGDLIPIRRGLYYKGATTRYGMTRPSAEEVAAEVFADPGVGPSGYSAARALGLTTQVPGELHICVVGPIAENVPGVVVHKRNNMARLRLRPLEIAVLEVLRAPDILSETGLDGLIRAVDDLVAAGKIRRDAIDKAAVREHSTKVRGNVGRLCLAHEVGTT